MGLVDVRRFTVTTREEAHGELAVDDIWLAEEDEWDINLAQVVEVNALAVPAKRAAIYPVMQHELRLLTSYLSDRPGVPLNMRRKEFKASSGHIKSFVSESFGLGMLTAAVERHYRWKLISTDLENFDVLPVKIAKQYSASGTRPDLLFDFSSQGSEKRLAGEARGRSTRRPKRVSKGQRDRLAKIVAWSGRNDFHPVTMTWAYNGANKVQVDLFDIQVPEDLAVAGRLEPEARHRLMTVLSGYEDEPLEAIREQALGRASAIASELYRSAPQPREDWQIFGTNVRGDWTTADLVAPSNLRFFLGVLDRPLDRRRAGGPRRAQARSDNRDRDPIQIHGPGKLVLWGLMFLLSV